MVKFWLNRISFENVFPRPSPVNVSCHWPGEWFYFFKNIHYILRRLWLCLKSLSRLLHCQGSFNSDEAEGIVKEVRCENSSNCRLLQDTVVLFVLSPWGLNITQWLPHDCVCLLLLVSSGLSALRALSAVTTTAKLWSTSGRPALWSAASRSWSSSRKPTNTSVTFKASQLHSTLRQNRIRVLLIDWLIDLPFAVTCAVMQKTGAGLHTANSCYWDTTMDGENQCCLFKKNTIMTWLDQIFNSAAQLGWWDIQV